jgi:hypothetical protein
MTVAAVLGIAACEEENAAFEPLVDTTPPTVSIESVDNSADTLRTTVKSTDFIGVLIVVTEIRRTDQFETQITPDGDTLTLGRLLVADTARTSGRVTDFTVNTTFLLPFAQATPVEVRAVAIDTQGNSAATSTLVLVGGAGPGGGLGGPLIAITSPLPNQTVRDNTLIRVGIRATDLTGLAQINVVLTGITPPTVPAADTIRFSEFRTDVDTLLDFFIPQGALGQLTITAEAINLNTISAIAFITVTVATEVPGDTIPPVVSMLVTGGVQRRFQEPPRMEIDDSLTFNITAFDLETAVTRIGVTLVITNNRPTGSTTDTIFVDSTFNPAISGTVPMNFSLMPQDLPASIFIENDIPDTLFMQVTAWAFDAADPSRNCGATIDPDGGSNSLECTTGDPILAQGIQGGFVERMVVAGRTVGFPQGSLIADAAVDTIRELMLLSDFNFGIVRPFDLRNEVFADNVPIGSNPWGLFIDLTEDRLLVSNSGGTNISLVDLGPRTVGAISLPGEIDRYQTQDLKVYRIFSDFDGRGIFFPTEFFEYSDRPQFLAQAANGLILFSTVPALASLPGTIREFDPVQREIRFFIQYADRVSAFSEPQLQIINADSVFDVNGSRAFKICDHTRGDPSPASRSCIIASDSLGDAQVKVAAKVISDGWDTEVHSDLLISSIGLQDTTFVAASGDNEFVAFGEGDTPERSGRIIMYRSATQNITNSLQVSDLPGNAEQRVFGLGLNNDGSLGVARGTNAYFFGPDQPGGPNVLRLLGVNEVINEFGTGAALHPDNDAASINNADERLTFLGSDDAQIEIVDSWFYSFKRGQVLIRDPIVGPLRITRRIQGVDPANVAVKLYGITANGVVVIRVKDTDYITP